MNLIATLGIIYILNEHSFNILHMEGIAGELKMAGIAQKTDAIHMAS